MPDSNAASSPESGASALGIRRWRTGRIVLVFLAAVVALLAAAPSAVGSLGRGRIEAAAAEALEADVAIGDLSLGWLSGVRIDGLDVRSKDPSKPSFRIGSIDAKPDMAALLQGRISVPHLVIKHVALDMTAGPESQEDEEDEEEGGAGDPRKRALPDFGVHATIEDVTLVYRSPGWEEPLRIDRIGPMTISANSQDATHVELVAAPGVNATIDVLWAKDGKRLRRKERSISAEAKLADANLAAFRSAAAPWLGTLSGIAGGEVRFRTEGKSLVSDGTIRLKNVAAGLRGASESHQAADVVFSHDIRREGADRTWSGNFQLGVVEGRMAPPSTLGKPLAFDRVDVVGRLSGDLRVDVERLAVAADFGTVDGAGSFAAGREPAATHAQVSVKADAAKLAQWLGGLPAVSGSIDSSAAVVLAPGGLISLRGATKIEGFEAADVPGVGAIREREIVLKHDLDYGEDAIRMHDVSLTSSFATAKCTGSLQPGDGGAAPEGNLDVQASLALDVIAGLLGTHLPVRPSGRLDVQGRLAGSADGITLDLTLRGERVLVSGGPILSPLDLGNLRAVAKGRLSSDRARLDLGEWSLRSRVGDVAGALQADLKADDRPVVGLSASGSLLPDVVLPSIMAEPPRGRIGAVEFAGVVAGDADAWNVAIEKIAAMGLTARGSTSLPRTGGSQAQRFDLVLSGKLDDAARIFIDGYAVTGSVKADLSGSLGATPVVQASIQAENLRARANESGAVIGGDALVSGRIDASQAFEAKLESPKLTFTDKDGRSVAGAASVQAQGRFDRDRGAVTIDRLAASGPGAALSGRGSFEPGRFADVDLRADLQTANAAPILAFVAPDVACSGAGLVTAKGRVSLAEPRRPEDSNGTLIVRMDGVKTEMLDLRNVDVEVGLDQGLAKTRKATAGLNDGIANLDLSVDMRSAVPEWKANANLDRVRITKEMQPAIARAIPIFSGIAVIVKGTIGATLDLSGRGASWDAVKPTLTGTGLLRGSGAQLSNSEILSVVGQFVGIPRDLPFDDFETRFRIQNGAVHQDRFVLSSAYADLRMSGTTSLDGRLDYELGVRPKGKASDQWRRLGRLLDGEGFLAMRLKGDVEDPDLKPPKVDDILRGTAEDLLKDKLEGLFKKKKKED